MARQYKNARKAQKLMAKDAAAKLDVSPSTLGAWEAERKTPSIESLEAMADLYTHPCCPRFPEQLRNHPHQCSTKTKRQGSFHQFRNPEPSVLAETKNRSAAG